jgi:hypothetical protein
MARLDLDLLQVCGKRGRLGGIALPVLHLGPRLLERPLVGEAGWSAGPALTRRPAMRVASPRMPLPFDTSSLKLRVGAMGFSCGSGASGTASIFSMVRGFGGVRSSNSCGGNLDQAGAGQRSADGLDRRGAELGLGDAQVLARQRGLTHLCLCAPLGMRLSEGYEADGICDLLPGLFAGVEKPND